MVHAIFGPIISVVGHIPGLGDAISSALGSVENAISNALGSAEHEIDRGMGWSFHLMAKQATWLWEEVRGHAHLLENIAAALIPFGGTLERLIHAFRHVSQSTSAHASDIRHLNHRLHGIDRELRKLEREVSKGIGADVLP